MMTACWQLASDVIEYKYSNKTYLEKVNIPVSTQQILILAGNGGEVWKMMNSSLDRYDDTNELTMIDDLRF